MSTAVTRACGSMQRDADGDCSRPCADVGHFQPRTFLRSAGPISERAASTRMLGLRARDQAPAGSILKVDGVKLTQSP